MAQVRGGSNTTGNAPSPPPSKKNGCRTSMVNGSKFGVRSPGEALHSTKQKTATRIKVTHTGETIDEVDVTLSNHPGDTPAGTKMASGMTMEETHHGLTIGEGPVGGWWRNDYGDWEWWERPDTTTTTTATIADEGEQDNVELMQRASSSSRPSYAHPSDVEALSEGQWKPRDAVYGRRCWGIFSKIIDGSGEYPNEIYECSYSMWRKTWGARSRRVHRKEKKWHAPW